jgi:hypothetical protein
MTTCPIAFHSRLFEFSCHLVCDIERSSSREPGAGCTSDGRHGRSVLDAASCFGRDIAPSHV